MTLIIAGTDTSSNVAGMSLYNLAKYPDVLKKIKRINW